MLFSPLFFFFCPFFPMDLPTSCSNPPLIWRPFLTPPFSQAVSKSLMSLHNLASSFTCHLYSSPYFTIVGSPRVHLTQHLSGWSFWKWFLPLQSPLRCWGHPTNECFAQIWQKEESIESERLCPFPTLPWELLTPPFIPITLVLIRPKETENKSLCTCLPSILPSFFPSFPESSKLV